VRIFISHQKADERFSVEAANRLSVVHGIECYLDVIDPYINGRIEDLADHIRMKMSDCTQLLAIVSNATIASQWVPWEIGVATEKDLPLATYSADGQKPLEFLAKWPYLRSIGDLDQYALASKVATSEISLEMLNEATASGTRVRRLSTAQFYKTLRAQLHQ
jgi:hypothetical protein